MEDEYIFTCEKCKAGFTDNEAEWLDDDENERGEHKLCFGRQPEIIPEYDRLVKVGGKIE